MGAFGEDGLGGVFNACGEEALEYDLGYIEVKGEKVWAGKRDIESIQLTRLVTRDRSGPPF